MNENKLESIKISLMKSHGDVKKDNKADYIVRSTGTFKIPEEFYKNLSEEEKIELTRELIESMYSELIEHNKNDDVDSLGLWIEYDNKTFDNSMKLIALSDIKKYSTEELSPVYELLKMTIEKDESEIS